MLCVWKGLCDLCVTTKVSPPIFPAHRSWWHPTCQMTPHDPFAWERGLPCARMCVWMCKIPLGRTCQREGHQICLWVCARLSQCTYHLCVCVRAWWGRGGGVRGWWGWDGQLHHAYLKGHSVIVGQHFTEPCCGDRKANWSQTCGDRRRIELKDIRHALEYCGSPKHISKRW